MVNTGKVMFRIQSLNNMGWVDINTWMGWVKKHFNVFNTAYIQVVNTDPKIGKTYVINTSVKQNHRKIMCSLFWCIMF